MNRLFLSVGEDGGHAHVHNSLSHFAIFVFLYLLAHVTVNSKQTDRASLSSFMHDLDPHLIRMPLSVEAINCATSSFFLIVFSLLPSLPRALM